MNQSICEINAVFILYAGRPIPARPPDCARDSETAFPADCSYFSIPNADKPCENHWTGPAWPPNASLPEGVGDSNMKRVKSIAWAACVLSAMITSGCQSMGTVARGQSPEGDVVPAGHIHKHREPVKAAASGLADHYHGHHNTSTTFYHQKSSPGGCPGCPGAHGGHHCPGGHHPGVRSDYGGLRYHPALHMLHPQGPYETPMDWHPRHGFSYSYKQPNDLVYPPPGPAGGAGGVIVYPYYTHKGPSDFFRTE